MKITRRSPLTGKETTMDLPITEEQLIAYKAWCNAPFLFPQLSPDEREFIMTGYTAEDWTKIFPPEDEESEDDEPAF